MHPLDIIYFHLCQSYELVHFLIVGIKNSSWHLNFLLRPALISKLSIITNNIQVKNPSLFKDKSLVGGQWVEAKSGKRFDVIGKASSTSNAEQNLIPRQIRDLIKSGHLLLTTQPRM